MNSCPVANDTSEVVVVEVAPETVVAGSDEQDAVVYSGEAAPRQNR